MTTGQPEKQLKLTRASDIRARKVHFIARDLIPMGTLTVLSGNSGIGKTTIALQYLAQLTRGTLDGFYKGKPQTVLILSPEDDEASITRPRLEAAGADLDRVHFMSATRRTDTGEIDSYIQFPADIPMLEEAVKQTAAAAVLIDPISSLISGNLDKREDVRAAFDPLAAQIAKEYRLGIILIAHNRKGVGQVRHMVSGSTAITDAARSVLAVAKDDENETIVLAVDKSSYSQSEGMNLAYRLTSVDVPLANGQTTTVARADYVGESQVTVAELHARHSGEEHASQERSEIERHIYEYLVDCGGSAEAKDVIKAAAAAGFKPDDVKKARSRMRSPRIETQRQGFGQGAKYIWSMGDAMDAMDTGNTNTGTHGTHAESMGSKLAPVTPIGGEK